MLQIGYIILHKRNPKDFFAKILSWFIWLFLPKEDKKRYLRKYWHMSIIKRVYLDGVRVLEAAGKGVWEHEYKWEELTGCGIYPVYDVHPKELDDFCKDYLGEPYDVDNYLTVARSSIRRFILKKPYRIIDDEQMCWELARAWLDRNRACPVKDSVALLISDLERSSIPIELY